MPEPMFPLISAIVTFHAEGLLGHKTLLGLERLRRFANQRDVVVEFVLVLDSAESETIRIVRSSPVLRDCDQIIEVANHDQGASRNSGVVAARGEYVCLLDGDDYYSENWFIGALDTVNSKQGAVVVHPDYVVCFGQVHSIGKILDLDRTPDYPLANLFSVHPWVCSSFAKRDIYLRHPFLRSDSKQTGFGFEDWHWNLEVLAEGIRHVSAPSTALFYRRRSSSVLAGHHEQQVVVRPSRFFDAPETWLASEKKIAERSKLLAEAK